MAILTVHKKGYTRKAYTRKGGIKVKATKVSPSTFSIKDRGATGRGTKIIPPLKAGKLGGKGFFAKSKSQQKKIAFADAKKRGEKKTVGSLRAIQVFNKRVNPKVSNRAKQLSKEVAGSFKGKKQVSYPSGFKKKKIKEIA